MQDIPIGKDGIQVPIPTPDTQITRHGNWEYMSLGERQWKRRAGTLHWHTLDVPPSAEALPMELQLVREKQTPGEPNHWQFFLAREGQPGTIFEVRGDATAMYYNHIEDVNALVSDGYRDSYIIAQPTEQQTTRVRYWATHEVPPSAPNQAAVEENCQGWAIRVIGRLVREGIVEQKWQDFAVSIQEAVQ